MRCPLSKSQCLGDKKSHSDCRNDFLKMTFFIIVIHHQPMTSLSCGTTSQFWSQFKKWQNMFSPKYKTQCHWVMDFGKNMVFIFWIVIRIGRWFQLTNFSLAGDKWQWWKISFWKSHFCSHCESCCHPSTEFWTLVKALFVIFWLVINYCNNCMKEVEYNSKVLYIYLKGYWELLLGDRKYTKGSQGHATGKKRGRNGPKGQRGRTGQLTTRSLRNDCFEWLILNIVS